MRHVVSSAGIRLDPAKIKQVHNAIQHPLIWQILGSFFGLASYYRRFIHEFARIAHPLYTLTKRSGVYHWINN